MGTTALGANSSPRVHLKESLPPQFSFRLFQLLISHSPDFNPLPIINFLNFNCAEQAWLHFRTYIVLKFFSGRTFRIPPH